MQRQYGMHGVQFISVEYIEVFSIRYNYVCIKDTLFKKCYKWHFFSEEVEDEVDAYELLQAVDILAMLPKDFYDKIVWVPLNYSQ